jgi:hypothetical protein
MSRFSSRPTALAIAIAALVAAVGGTAMSAGAASHTDAAVDKALVLKLAPKLKVAKAKVADNLSFLRRAKVVTASVGQTKPLGNSGPFHFRLVCATTGGTEINAQVELRSSENHTAIESSSSVNNGNLPANTAYRVTDNVASANSAQSAVDGDSGYFSAFTPQRKVITGDAFVGVRVIGHDCAGGITLQR